MKKFISLFGTLLMTSQPLLATGDVYHIDFRVSAFYPQDKLYREIYGDWQPTYSIEAGKIFFKNYEAWVNFDWMSTSGHTDLYTGTSLENFNASLGGKYILNLPMCLNLYVGLGINGSYVHVHNDSIFVNQNVNKGGVGGVAKLGLFYQPINHLYCEIFADYLYQEIRFQNWRDLGGLKIGAGIGYIY